MIFNKKSQFQSHFCGEKLLLGMEAYANLLSTGRGYTLGLVVVTIGCMPKSECKGLAFFVH
ncbi:MAG: hypothetical protein WD005_04125 [Haliea sp.]